MIRHRVFKKVFYDSFFSFKYLFCVEFRKNAGVRSYEIYLIMNNILA